MLTPLRVVTGSVAALALAVGGAALVTAHGPVAGQSLDRAVGAATGGPSPARTPRPEADVAASFGSTGGAAYAPGRVLVAPAPGEATADLRRAAAELDATVADRLPGSRVRELRLPRGADVEQAVRRLQRDPAIAYAEPDFVVVPTGSLAAPNDPEFPKLYGLHNTGQTGGRPDADIDAPEAWRTTVGSDATVVAVIDTGTDIDHPDLRDNIWTNEGEVAGNGVDDDKNGYVDDVHGWDFAHHDNTVFDGTGDEHGTHVSGTIAATGGNGVGVTGVAWRARVMPLKFIAGTGYTSDAIEAINYAVANGATISNNSWGGSGFSRSLQDAIAAAGNQGHLFVTAAGNGGADGIGDNIDTSPQYPAAYPEPNVLTVAATDHTDTLATFSNFGATAVDLAAPGVRVYSTLPHNSYGAYSGTSMAAPHVAGAAALLLSADPRLDASGLKDRLLSSVDPVAALTEVATRGRLNIGNVFGSRPAPTVALSVSPPAVTVGSSSTLAGEVTDADSPVADAALTVEQRPVGQSTWTPVPGGGQVATDSTGAFTVAGVSPSANTDYRVRLADGSAESAIQRVNVRPVVSNLTPTTRLARNRSRALSGVVTPAHGGSVVLTVLRNGARVLRTTVTLVDSRYRRAYRPTRRGTYTVYATWPGDEDHLRARSLTRTFRVR